MSNFDNMIQYGGFKGANLDNYNFNKLKNILALDKILSNNIDYVFLNHSILNLDTLTLEEAKNIAKKFYDDYFNVHNINYVDEDLLDKTIKDMPDDTSSFEFYENINNILSSINPFDLPFSISKYDMDSRVVLPLYIFPNHNNEENRKIYFSKIVTGKLLNMLTPCFIAHEIVHLETESIIGYTDDILNREVLSIFIEKIIALTLDKKRHLLKLYEFLRFKYLIEYYKNYQIYNKKLSKEKNIELLIYIKSTLMAQKLFDMYTLDKNKDKYIYDVQKVFDGKIKVEELLIKNGITFDKCEDLTYLKRHI